MCIEIETSEADGRCFDSQEQVGVGADICSGPQGMDVCVSGPRASKSVRYCETVREAHEPSLRREVSGCDAMGI